MLKYIIADISANSSVCPHLFHETLAQSHDLGKQDGVVGQVRAQVAQHGEDVPGEIVKSFGRPRCLLAPQRRHQTTFGTFGDCSPKNTGRPESSHTALLSEFHLCFLSQHWIYSTAQNMCVYMPLTDAFNRKFGPVKTNNDFTLLGNKNQKVRKSQIFLLLFPSN